MYILGVNAYHGDSSACILKDGKLLVACEEERFKRVKHWAGFPVESIQYCLSDSGITINDIDLVAVSRDPSANFGLKVWSAVKNKLRFSSMLDRVKNLKKANSISTEFSKHFPDLNRRLKFRMVEHHLAHLASAYYVSGMDEAALISIDGFGDFSSMMSGSGSLHGIKIIDKVTYPHSIGLFYTSMTQFLGFPHYGDEYKIMGLAPYGNPRFVEDLEKVISCTDDGKFKLDLQYFNHTREGVSMSWENGLPEIGKMFSNELEKLFFPSRQVGEELLQIHKDFAASVQRHTENIIIHLLNSLQSKTGLKKLCLAGGVIQNSVANGKILQRTNFEEIYIPPAAHDAGTAIGAALQAFYELKPTAPKYICRDAYFGYHATNQEIELALRKSGVDYKYFEQMEELLDEVVQAITQRKVIGWYQGRAEFGPRALGHRSILADPRRLDAKDLLNEKIKRRESFRPFAPSILAEYVTEYFECNDEVPFMEKVYLIREEKRTLIPAVTHVDGSGRLQTVHKEVEPRYHRLIEKFFQQTGVPILLNTSFNENEPIVNTPAQAIDCFLRTQMDVLVLGNFLIAR